VSEKHLGKGSREVYFFGNQAQAGCLGLGKYSDSYIREVVEYNQKRKPNAPFTLNDKLYEVRILDNRKEMLKYVFNKLAEGKVDLKEIEERFNLKLDKEFEEPLTKLRELNLIEVDKRSLSFKEGDPLTIFTACLFFIDRDIVLNTLRNI
jgi:coproporphyrinogen III oxidase-like Fe-S oxidoreductase